MSRLPRYLIFAVAAAGLGAASAQVLDRSKIAELHQAVRLNDMAAVRAFADERGAYLNARGDGGYSPLQVAIRWGHGDLVALLLEMGADPNRADSDGRSALHLAASSNDQNAARLLLDSGALVNQRDNYRYTPLHMAARSGHTDLAHILIEAGADVNARIDVGFTAYDLAEAFPELRGYLRERGARAGAELPAGGG